MDIYEEAVLEYLTHEGKMFVCPQLRLEGEGIKVNPDFVALNFEDNPVQVEIVEVSEAYKLGNLVKKLRWYQENEKKIMKLLMNYLSALKGLGLTGSTPLVIRVFIQPEQVGKFRKRLNGLQNVQINSLDTVLKALLDWTKRTLSSEG
jgi:hypothetical protein